jgi:hypothetical protein
VNRKRSDEECAVERAYRKLDALRDAYIDRLLTRCTIETGNPSNRSPAASDYSAHR